MKISVITTCFNAAGTILDCLESVRHQTFFDVEHIVVDAASTDGTLALLEEYKKDSQQPAVEVSAALRLSSSRQYAENEFRMISEPDRGIYDGMNKGLRLATGDVVGILNADDFYFGPDVLAQVANVFESIQVESCYGDLVYVTGQRSYQSSVGSWQSSNPASPGVDSFQSSVISKERNFRVVRYWRSGEFDYRKFWWGWMVPHPTFFVRREVYERHGYFNLEMGTAADYELMLRFLVKHRITCAYLPEILIRMRSGGASNVTLKARLQANRMDRKAWEVNGLTPYPWTLPMKPLRKVGQWFSRPRP